MICANAFFKNSDQHVTVLGRYPLQLAWWSRLFEYPWALRHAKPGQVVADMGCGWMPRPFKEALADVCDTVYAVDLDNRLLEQPITKPNLTYYVGDFCDHLDGLPEFDTIFCISVLEDVQDCLELALKNFAAHLKQDGRIVVTFDVPYNDNLPCNKYPGMQVSHFEKMMELAGLKWQGEVDTSKADAIHHQGFNLTVFHGVLVHE